MVSIIVPAYNVEKTLEKCIKSIIVQTLKNLQIIIINDGSTDNTWSICEQLAYEDQRIEIYQIENRGAVGARKFGLKKAIGEYIGFVDADDYIEPEMFYELQNMIIKSKADFVHSGHVEERNGKQNIICNFEEEIVELENLQCKIEFLKKYIFEGNSKIISFSIWTKLFKAKLIKKCFEKLQNKQQYGEDFLCLIRCVFESRRVVLYNKPMYHYIVNGKSLSHVEYDDYTINEINMCHHMINVLDEYQCFEIEKECIYHFIKKRILCIILKTGCEKRRIPQFYFKNIKRLTGKRIVIFGAGNVGQDYYIQIRSEDKCEIVAWIDSHWGNYRFDYAEVIDVNNIKNLLFDIVIVAVNDEKIGLEIVSVLIKIGVDYRKIIFEKPGRYF